MNELLKYWDLKVPFGSINEMIPKYQHLLARYWYAGDENPETLLLYIGRAWNEYIKEVLDSKDVVTEASERATARLRGFLNILRGFKL